MMRIYFGKVYIEGMEKIPKDKPLILAANHQSAFIEPVLLGAIMPFPVHFITRGDIFIKTWMWFFKAVNMIPIFRFHDGFSQLKKNKDSFEHVYRALEKNARIIIFCEGHMKWEKKLHPLQLGAARMAVGAYDQNRDLDIYIVPIAINYEDHLTFRRYVKISIGDIIPIVEHAKDIDKSKRLVLKSVTKELSKNLKPHIIHIGSESHYELGNKLLSLYDNKEKRTFFPFVVQDKNKNQSSVDAANRSIKLDIDQRVYNKLQSYVDDIGDNFIYRDYILVHPKSFNLLAKLWFYSIVIPISLIGVIINGPPVFLALYVTKTRTTIPEFIGSLKSNLSSTLYLIYFILISTICLIISWKIVIPIWVLMILTGLFTTYYFDRRNYWKAKLYWARQPKSIVEDFKARRKELLNEFL